MFIKSYKMTSRRLAVIGVTFLVAVGFVVYGIGVRLREPRGENVGSVEAGTREGARAAKGMAKTAEQRLAFIAQFGWEVGGEPIEVAEVLIPEEFDEVYTRYNALQQQQGYDLEKHKGARAKRYTYAVLNYPDTKQEVHLSLIVLDGRVIGGDVSSTALSGFMQGFAKDSAVLNTEELETSLNEHSTPAVEAPIEAPIEETMAAELAAMEDALRSNLEQTAEPTEAQMPTD